MNFFEKIIRQLFSSPSQKAPMVSEPLKRKDAERSKYFEWQNSGAYKVLWDRLYQAYQARLNQEMGLWDIHLLQMKAANGFALTYPNDLSQQEFQHLFDLLKDRVLNLPYQLVNANRQIFDKDDYVETKEKYYLKPIIDFQDTSELYNQRYGNIIIEQILIDDRPSYLKLVANIYSDRLYTKALGFDVFMREIFE